MTAQRDRVKAFFDEYARLTNDALRNPPVEDVDRQAACFADYFVGSSPRGVQGAANGPELRTVIPQGWARYRHIGGTAMNVTAVTVTELDPLHVMARVAWDFEYVRDGRTGHIGFENHYFLTEAGGALKIFAYITPDEQQAMEDHGLL